MRTGLSPELQLLPREDSFMLSTRRVMNAICCASHFCLSSVFGGRRARLNCEWQVVYVDGWPHVILCSIPDVPLLHGEQLFVDYGSAWYEAADAASLRNARQQLRGMRLLQRRGGAAAAAAVAAAAAAAAAEDDEDEQTYSHDQLCALVQEPPSRDVEWFCCLCMHFARRVLKGRFFMGTGEAKAHQTSSSARAPVYASLKAAWRAAAGGLPVPRRAADASPSVAAADETLVAVPLEGVSGGPALPEASPLQVLKPCGDCRKMFGQDANAITCREEKGRRKGTPVPERDATPRERRLADRQEDYLKGKLSWCEVDKKDMFAVFLRVHKLHFSQSAVVDGSWGDSPLVVCQTVIRALTDALVAYRRAELETEEALRNPQEAAASISPSAAAAMIHRMGSSGTPFVPLLGIYPGRTRVERKFKEGLFVVRREGSFLQALAGKLK
ncbi:AP2 domain transcription factor ap2viia-7 [Cyclospora cayetanensis]|uniref:AP2 domain transcription factor ap2viia-7 n=1 Tax=Cyclospora cayetanensis TaxID=88456 RepID=A0A1D3CZC6_9EIME|nr:AP2 domain transcription factor ap2viia-7 [Cyclospora cayetanensis]